MFSSIRAVAGPLSATLFLLMGVALVHTITALHGEALGFSVADIGVLSTAYYIGFFAGTYSIPKLIHAIGHIRTFAFCTATVTIIVLLQGAIPNFAAWFILRVLQGLALVGLYTVIESWLNATADPKHHTAIFAIYMMLNLGGMAIGQQLLRIPGEVFVLFSTIAILFCLAGLPVITTRQPQPPVQEVPKLQVFGLFKRVPTAIVSALVSGLVMGSVWGLLPLYASSIGFDTTGVGTYMSIAILGGVVLQWPLGYFADHIDRRIALAVISLIGTAMAITILLLHTRNHMLSMALIFVFAGVGLTIYPIAVAHLVDYLKPAEMLAASSTVLLMEGIGSAIGPLVAGNLMEYIHPSTLFVFFAALDGFLALYTLYRFKARDREVTPDDNFIPMVQSSPTALDLHPSTGTEDDETDMPLDAEPATENANA